VRAAPAGDSVPQNAYSSERSPGTNRSRAAAIASIYAKPPFDGPEAVLAYLGRYTHRVAIANSRLIALDERGVTFRYKDYRRNRQARYRTMTLSADEFIRRFLLHVLPEGFHRIRHYGLLASAGCKANIARARELMLASMPEVEPPPAAQDTADPDATTDHRPPCPCCGGRMIIVGARRVWRVLGHEAHAAVCCERTLTSPFGLAGGLSGRPMRLWLELPDSTVQHINSKESFRVPPFLPLPASSTLSRSDFAKRGLSAALKMGPRLVVLGLLRLWPLLLLTPYRRARTAD
jgi:putative transposase